MKNIGDKLKEARESIGISIEEVAEDLKFKPSQIENVEDGNIKAFKDKFALKNFIRDYSKYLGLNYDDLIDEFNEYLFDYTSQISIEDIKKATKEKNDNCKKEKRISSPYTIEHKEKRSIIPKVIIGIILLLIIVIGFLVYTDYKDNHKQESDVTNRID